MGRSCAGGERAVLYMVLIYWFMSGVNNVSGGWNQILRNEVFLGYLNRFQKLPERTGSAELGTGTSDIISFRDVWFRYPGAE